MQKALLHNFFISLFFYFNDTLWWLAIKATPTVRECGPHVHCADHTPHSKPKKVRTRTVIRTSKCAVQMTTNPKKFIKKNFEKKIQNFFSNFLGLVVIWTAHLAVRITVLVRSSAHLLSSVRVWVRTAHQNEGCAWSLICLPMFCITNCRSNGRKY